MYDIVRKGYIEVYRVEGAERIFVSRHVDEAEAVGAANNHGETHGGGRYLLLYPNKEVDVRIIVQGPAPTLPVISALPVAGSGTEIDIELTAPSSGPAPPYTYRLQEASTLAGPFSEIASGAVFTGSPLRYRRGGLPAVTTRHYRVLATDSASPTRSSELSAVTSATTHDVVPAAFDFVDVSGAAQSALIESNAVTITGITTPVSISVAGGEYRVNGGPWQATSGTIGNDNTVQVRRTSASAPDTSVTVILTISTLTADWIVRTASTSALTWPLHSPSYALGPPALPRHASFGMDSRGGGGRHLGTPATTVILVNSLDGGAASGNAVTGLGANVFEGNWRFAWQHTASPKVIIPLVGGWIRADRRINSVQDQSFWSYWGQFAPGAGLFLRATTPVVLGGSDIQVWHLRSYIGDDAEIVGNNYNADVRDGLTVGGGTSPQTLRNLFINCDFAWSIDEIFEAFFGFASMSCLYCAFIEPLHKSTLQHVGDPVGAEHGFGPLFGGNGTPQCDRLHLMRNLFAHGIGRNPLLTAQRFSHVNNLNYNHANNAVHWHPTQSLAMVSNILGNGFMRGPDNGSTLKAVACQVAVHAASGTFLSGNAQHGWTNPTSQAGFVTEAPTGWVKSTAQLEGMSEFWGGEALTGILQWAANPLAPTNEEWNRFLDLMQASVGALPGRSQPGRRALMFTQMRNQIIAPSGTPQYVDTVTQAGGWFPVANSGPINPLNPGSAWHAPLPTGPDRDQILGTGTLANGASAAGYTRLEAWALDQHYFVGGQIGTGGGGGGDPLDLPLVQSSSPIFSFVGTFSLPATIQQDNGVGSGGLAMSADGNSMYVTSFYGSVAKISVPASGTGSAGLQIGWTSTPGSAGENQNKLSALEYGGQVYCSKYSTYTDQAQSGWIQRGTTSLTGFTGLSATSGQNARLFCQAFMHIPAIWRSILGGPVAALGSRLSIISNAQCGYGFAVFDPVNVGANVPVSLLLNYPYSNALEPGDAGFAGWSSYPKNANGGTDLFSSTNAYVAGAFIPPGSRSLLFITVHGYGVANNGCRPNSSVNNDPNRVQIVAYDLRDLVAVKNGAMQPYAVRPYAWWTWNASGVHWSSCAGGVPNEAGWGVFDPVRSRWYMCENMFGSPMHSWNVTGL